MIDEKQILVEIDNLVINFYTYHGIVKAIDGVDLIIMKGETFGLVGETGCGKSVTAKTIMKLINSPPGKIEEGNIYFMEPKDIRDRRKIFERDAQRWYDKLSPEDRKKMALRFTPRFTGFKRRVKPPKAEEIDQFSPPHRAPNLLISSYLRDRAKRKKVKEPADLDVLDQRYDLVNKSNKYMEKIRGRFISMIFQEPMSALNPVFPIGDQIAEGILLHQKKQLAQAILKRYDSQIKNDNGGSRFRRGNINILRLIVKAPDSRYIKLLEKIPVIRGFNKELHRMAIRKAIDMLKVVRIPDPEDIIDRYPHELSGGMQQRVMIAMALSSTPQLLIADEPTTALDVTIQAQILNLMRDLKASSGGSILLITHNLGVVAETCDRVGVMYAGSMAEIADVHSIFKKPLHPYTIELLRSIPSVHEDAERLSTIRGSVPNLIDPPTGCRFNPRCTYATSICRRERPELLEIEEGHFIACHKVTGAQGYG